jgi:hypothetical protein
MNRRLGFRAAHFLAPNEVQPPFEEAHSGFTAAAASLSSSKPTAD